MTRARVVDAVAVVVLIGVSLAYASALNFERPPFEDAAMIMRYAEHLATGHGIVWNIGQAPVDGATDFLFLVVVAALRWLGMNVESAVRWITALSHLATVVLVYLANRSLWRAPVPIAMFLAWYLAAGTGPAYVAASFGTPFYALFAVLTWIAALRIMQTENPSTRAYLVFSILGLTTGLIRPDGVILATLMALAIVCLKGWKEALRGAVIFGTVFGILGGAYFLWRWQYFGHPLPNPYYKKGAGTLHWESFYSSVLGMARFAWPLLPAFALGFRSPDRARRVVAAVLPAGMFAAAFILISDEMNFGGRFQYVTLPLLLLAVMIPVGDLLTALHDRWSTPRSGQWRIGWALAAAMAAFMMVRYSAAQRCVFLAAPEVCSGTPDTGSPTTPSANSGGLLYRTAKFLGGYQGKGYVLATTEAGLLPFYSTWTSVDMWGLNDYWIAHNNGQITAEYLDEWQPHVVVSHAYFSPVSVPASTQFSADPWNRMTLTIRDYVTARPYRLVGAFGSSANSLFYYYVRTDFEDADPIAEGLLAEARAVGIRNYASPD